MTCGNWRVTGVLGAASVHGGKDIITLKKISERVLLEKSLSYTLVERQGFFLYLIYDLEDRAEPQPDYSGECRIVIGEVVSDNRQEISSGHFLELTLGESASCIFRSDPVGLVNLYRWKNDFNVIFGTSSMHVAALVPEFRVDELGLYEFMAAGYLVSKTYYEGIDVLPGGIDWQISADTLPEGKEKRWYAFPLCDEPALKEEEAVAALINSTRTAAMAVSSAGHACCDLTAGYDSRGIASMFIKAGVPFSTVVNGAVELPDVVVASEIAKAFQLDHHHNDNALFPLPKTIDDIRKILFLTDGEIDFVEYYYTALIHKKIANKGWLSVNGSGGELFRGYWWEGEWPKEGERREVNREYLLKRIMLPGLDFSRFKMTIHDVQAHFSSVMSQVMGSAGEEAMNGQKIDSLYFHLRLGRWLARYYSSTMKIIPCYSPFLFRTVLDVALHVEPKAKKRVRFYKKWLEANHRELALIPLENGAPPVPLTAASMWRYWRFPSHICRKIADRLQKKLLPKRGQLTNPLVSAYLDIGIRQLQMSDSVVFHTAPVVEDSLIDELMRMSGSNIPENMPIGQLTRLVTAELTLREVSHLREIARETNKDCTE